MNTTIKNAIITSTTLDMGERGLLTGWLHLDYGGTHQGFGGHVLYLPKSYAHHSVESLAGHFIFRCMEIAGVDDWSKLPGKAIRVRMTDAGIDAIGHIIKEDWFCPEQDFPKN